MIRIHHLEAIDAITGVETAINGDAIRSLRLGIERNGSHARRSAILTVAVQGAKRGNLDVNKLRAVDPFWPSRKHPGTCVSNQTLWSGQTKGNKRCPAGRIEPPTGERQLAERPEGGLHDSGMALKGRGRSISGSKGILILREGRLSSGRKDCR
jgi:hypothetical protein